MVKRVEKVITQTLLVGNRKNSQTGFTYVMILVVVIITGIFAEVASIYTSRLRQMDREAELLFRGEAYRSAIKSFYESGVPIKAFPHALSDLVKDPRSVKKSHLRTLYPDPFGSELEGWMLLRASDGGISGVASKSMAIPIKTGNFKLGNEKFENAATYTQWVFEYANAVSGIAVLAK